MDWFLGTVIIIIAVFIVIRLLIRAAGRQMEDSADLIKQSAEDFKLPKIKIVDLIGYAGYQMFEMAKPGIQASIEGWIDEQQHSAGDIIVQTDNQGPS